MKCNRQHGGEYPNNRIVYFCTNSTCLIKLSCGECRYDYHKDHDLVRIQDFQQFAQQHLESSNIVHMDFVMTQINNLKQQLLVPIESFCQSLLSSIPNVSAYTHLKQEDITEDVLNKLLKRQIEVKQHQTDYGSEEDKFVQLQIITQQLEIKSDEEIIQEKGLAEQQQQLQQLVDSEAESIQKQIFQLEQKLESEINQNKLLRSENDQLLILQEEQSQKIQELLTLNENNQISMMDYIEKLQEYQIKIPHLQFSLDQAQLQIQIKEIEESNLNQQKLENQIAYLESSYETIKEKFDQQLDISLGFSQNNQCLQEQFQLKEKQIDRQALEIKLLKAMNEAFQEEIRNLQQERIQIQEQLQSNINESQITSQIQHSQTIEIQNLKELVNTLVKQKNQDTDEINKLEKYHQLQMEDLVNEKKNSQSYQNLEFNNTKILQQQQHVQQLVIDNENLTQQNRVSAALIVQQNDKIKELYIEATELQDLKQERDNLLANQNQMEDLIQKYRDMLELQSKPQIQSQNINNHSIDSLILQKLTKSQSNYFTDSILQSIDGYKVCSSLKLIFRGSRDGFYGQQFAQQCFYICKTIILLRTENNQTIGCYIPLQLNNYNGFWKKDQSNTTMMFSLTKKEIYHLSEDCQDKALQTGYTDGYYFLIQLGYQDLYIFLPHSQEQIEQYPPNVFSLFPHSFELIQCKPAVHNDYTHDQYLLNAPNSNNRMKRMRIAEMEVYAIQ